MSLERNHSGMTRREPLTSGGTWAVLVDGLRRLRDWTRQLPDAADKRIERASEVFRADFEDIRRLVRRRVKAAVGTVLEEFGGAEQVLSQVSLARCDSTDTLVDRIIVVAEGVHATLAGQKSLETADVELNNEEIVRTVRTLVTRAIESEGKSLAINGVHTAGVREEAFDRKPQVAL